MKKMSVVNFHIIILCKLFSCWWNDLFIKLSALGFQTSRFFLQQSIFLKTRFLWTKNFQYQILSLTLSICSHVGSERAETDRERERERNMKWDTENKWRKWGMRGRETDEDPALLDHKWSALRTGINGSDMSWRPIVIQYLKTTFKRWSEDESHL